MLPVMRDVSVISHCLGWAQWEGSGVVLSFGGPREKAVRTARRATARSRGLQLPQHPRDGTEEQGRGGSCFPRAGEAWQSPP